MSEIVETQVPVAEIENLLRDHHRQYHITHLRKEDRVMEEVDPKGGITLAFKVYRHTKPSGYPGFTIYYGIAICNDKDRYDKRIGREIAIERANDAGLFQWELFEMGSPLTKEDWTDDYGTCEITLHEEATFTGCGSFSIDLAPEMVTAKSELVPSRFLHIAVVREIMKHARIQCNDALDDVWEESLAAKVAGDVFEALVFPYMIDGNVL